MMNKKFLRDLAERVGAMFALTFLGQVAVIDPADILNISLLRAAAVSAIFASLSLAKGVLARRVGDGDSAALLPALSPTE